LSDDEHVNQTDHLVHYSLCFHHAPAAFETIKDEIFLPTTQNNLHSLSSRIKTLPYDRLYKHQDGGNFCTYLGSEMETFMKLNRIFHKHVILIVQ
jgi:hypothetical protein